MKVVISGLLGSGSTTLSKEISKSMNLEYVSAGDMFQNMAEKRFPGFINGHSIALLENQKRTVEDIYSEKENIDNAILLKFLKGNNLVIDSKFFWHLANSINDPNSIRVLVMCRGDERARRIAKKKSFSTAKAEEYLTNKEFLLGRKFREMYGSGSSFDLATGHGFHYVIDTFRLSIPKAVENVLQFLNEWKEYKSRAL